VRRALDRSGTPFTTWYELVNGGRLPSYLQLVHRAGWAGWDTRRLELATLLATVGDSATRSGLSSLLAEIVTDITSETWRYLPESSLIPRRQAGRRARPSRGIAENGSPDTHRGLNAFESVAPAAPAVHHHRGRQRRRRRGC